MRVVKSTFEEVKQAYVQNTYQHIYIFGICEIHIKLQVKFCFEFCREL